MSSRYLHLSCSVADCPNAEMVYIGSLDTDLFNINLNGEQLSIECDEHQDDTRPEPPGFEGTRAALDALTIRGGA